MITPEPKPQRWQVPWWARILLVVCVALAAFSAGRFSAPLQVEEHEHVTETVREDRELAAKYEAAISESNVWRQRLEQNQKTIKIKIPVLLSCDGGAPVIASREEETTESTSRAEASGNTETVAKAQGEVKESVQRVETREIIREKVTTLRPDWRVSLLAGTAIKAPGPEGMLLTAPPLVLGAELDRRIAGGFTLGLWVAVQLAVTPSVKFEQAALGARASIDL